MKALKSVGSNAVAPFVGIFGGRAARALAPCLLAVSLVMGAVPASAGKPVPLTDEETFAAYMEAGGRAVEAGELVEARRQYELAVALSKRRFRGDERYPTAFFNLARVSVAQGDLKRARQNLVLARQAARKSYGEDSVEVAVVSVYLVETLRRMGLAVEARRGLTATTLLLEDPPAESTLPYCRALGLLGYTRQMLGELTSSQEAFESALRCYESMPSSYPRAQLIGVNRYAHLLHFTGQDSALMDLGEIRSSLCQALEADPNYTEGVECFALGMDELDKLDEAVAEAEVYASEWFAERHVSQGDFDSGPLRELVVRSYAEGVSLEDMEPILQGEIHRQLYSFAPKGAVPDKTVRYGLPFDREIPRLVGQGFGGKLTHRDSANYHAIDFVFPIGTPIHAARAGQVARVIEGFDEHGYGEEYKGKLHANEVLVLHEDGTFAAYVHMKYGEGGIVVREGDAVERGDLLGYSGFNGYSGGPHLHFSVLRRGATGMFASVSIRFDDESERGFVPKESQLIGLVPESTGELQVLVDGKRVEGEEEAKFALPEGESVQVQVLYQEEGETPIDVTNDPRITYDAGSFITASVSTTGVVTAAPAGGFEKIDVDSTALDEFKKIIPPYDFILVYFGGSKDEVYGRASVRFTVGDELVGSADEATVSVEAESAEVEEASLEEGDDPAAAATGAADEEPESEPDETPTEDSRESATEAEDDSSDLMA